jgi:acetyl-CoA acetyltransferase
MTASYLDEVAIAGVAETPVGAVPEFSSMELHAVAVRTALADAGLELNDVDGLVTANSRVDPILYHADVLAEYLGRHPRHVFTLSAGGSMNVIAVEHAAALIAAGICQVVVIAKADNLLTGLGRDATVASMATIGHPDYEAPSGPTIPALYALAAQRYIHDYNIDIGDLALVAEIDRSHAALHPGAQFREPLTAQEVLSSRLIADPLHLYDCAPISDGGAAIVVTSIERARDLAKPPIRILGIGEHHSFEHMTQSDDLSTTGAAFSGPAAFEAAGLTPEEIDVAMVYDAFSFIQCMQLEDLGFCAKGEGGEFVRAGFTRLGGRLPVNTHGGVLSFGHPGKPTGMFMITEAVKQLRHEAGARQVHGAETALVHVEGGILGSHGTMILGVDR